MENWLIIQVNKQSQTIIIIRLALKWAEDTILALQFNKLKVVKNSGITTTSGFSGILMSQVS